MRRADWQHPGRALAFLKANLLSVSFALEIFAGSGHFSQAWRQQIGTPIIEFDLKHGGQYDATMPGIQKRIR
eukprot:2462957-Pyramimonas_sp.AAC.1